MKKLSVILLLALFAIGFTSCAEDPMETDPVIPEVNQEVMDELRQEKSSTRERKKSGVRTSTRTRMGS